MLNLRVRHLDGLIEQLTAGGIDVIAKPEWQSPRSVSSLESTIPKAMRSSYGSRPQISTVPGGVNNATHDSNAGERPMSTTPPSIATMQRASNASATPLAESRSPRSATPTTTPAIG